MWRSPQLQSWSMMLCMNDKESNLKWSSVEKRTWNVCFFSHSSFFFSFHFAVLFSSTFPCLFHCRLKDCSINFLFLSSVSCLSLHLGLQITPHCSVFPQFPKLTSQIAYFTGSRKCLKWVFSSKVPESSTHPFGHMLITCGSSLNDVLFKNQCIPLWLKSKLLLINVTRQQHRSPANSIIHILSHIGWSC